MRRQTGWMAGLSALALLVAAWVTTASYVPALRGARDTVEARDPGRIPGSDSGRGDGSQSPRATEVPGWLDALFVSLLVVLGAVLLALLIRANIQRRRRKRALRLMAEKEVDPLDGPDEEALRVRLGRSAGESLIRLHEGDPRNAIVRCWVNLEQTVEAAGLPRDPALTSEEFTAEVLIGYAVTSETIAELAELYREARFSEHSLGESQRERAVAALNSLRDELELARSTPTGSGVAES